MPEEEKKEEKKPKLAEIGKIKHRHDKCNPPNIDVPNIAGSALSVISGYAKKDIPKFVIGIFALILGSLANFAVPGLIGIVVDAMTAEPTDWDTITFSCTSMMLLVLVSGIFAWLRATTFNGISERIAMRIKYDLFFFVINKDVAYFDETKTGDILSRISSDTSVIQDGLSTNVSMALRCSIIIICTLVILCLISWKLTLVTLGGITPVILFTVFTGKL